MEKGPDVHYECPDCGFHAYVTYCDNCDSKITWDDYSKTSAHCSSCNTEIHFITCRKCGCRFNL